jgi:acyl carrier protein
MDSNLKAQIREFVMENARGKGITELSDLDSLISTGIVDSLGIFRLRIPDDEIVNDNFQTIDDIDRFVSAKLEAKGKAPATA